VYVRSTRTSGFRVEQSIECPSGRPGERRKVAASDGRRPAHSDRKSGEPALRASPTTLFCAGLRDTVALSGSGTALGIARISSRPRPGGFFSNGSRRINADARPRTEPRETGASPQNVVQAAAYARLLSTNGPFAIVRISQVLTRTSEWPESFLTAPNAVGFLSSGSYFFSLSGTRLTVRLSSSSFFDAGWIKYAALLTSVHGRSLRLNMKTAPPDGSQLDGKAPPHSP